MIATSSSTPSGVTALHVLGRVDLRASSGESVAALLAQSKRMALLAVLAVDGSTRRDVLRALLWPESDDARARHALNQTLYKIRGTIGMDAVLSVGPEQLQLDKRSFWSDAGAFREHLLAGRSEAALALYEGDLMPGLHVSDSPEFEEWLADRRRALRTAASDAAHRLCEAARREGNWRGVVDWARRGLVIEPHDEVALHGLVGGLLRTGQRTTALQEYASFAGRLERDFGIAPSAETRQLLETIEAGAGGAIEVRSRVTPDPGGTTVTPERPNRPPRLASPPDGEPFPPPGRENVQRRRRPWVAAVLTPLLIVGAYAWSNRGPSETRIDPRRIIVVPLTNETGDDTLAPIGGWAADWITDGLQATGVLDVVDPVTGYVSRVRQPANGAADETGRTLHLARSLGAGTVVWGAYRRAGDSLHATVRVSDVDTGLGRQTISASGLASNPSPLVQQLRSRVAGALAGALDNRIATLQPAPRDPPRLEAYQEYIAGLDLFVRDDYVESVPYFLQAARVDSTFMLPRIWALFALGNSFQMERFDSLLTAVVPLRARMSPLDQYSLDYHVARRNGDNRGALQASKRAARLAPQSNWTYMVSMLASDFNRPQEAVEAIEQLSSTAGWAVDWPYYWIVRATAHHIAGDHVTELRVVDQGIATIGADPLVVRRVDALSALGRVKDIFVLLDSLDTNPLLRGLAAYEAGMDLRVHGHREVAGPLFERAIADIANAVRESPRDRDLRRLCAQFLYFAGRWQEAETIVEALVQEDFVHYDTYVMLAYSAAHRADTTRAWAFVDRLPDDQASNPVGTRLFVYACVWAILGNKDEAVRYIRETLDAGYDAMQFHQDSNLESLWDYPPYLEAIRPRG